MTTSRTSLLAGCMLLAACSGEGKEQAADAYRIVATESVFGADHPLSRALGAHPSIAAVFDYHDVIGRAGDAPAQPAGLKIVTGVFGGAAARQLVAEGKRAAACASPSAPAAAIDAALLACSGIAVPKELGLGVTWFTAANVAAGGMHELAPGDLALEAQRRQHGATLTTNPATDMVFRVGLVDAGDATPGGKALRDELIAAAKRYPQLQLIVGSPRANPEERTAMARDFIARNVNGLLLVMDPFGDVSKVCPEASALNIKVIVLGAPIGSDDFVCRVDMDPGALGRAAAAAIRSLLPGGGDVVELTWQHMLPEGAVHDAFARALGATSR